MIKAENLSFIPVIRLIRPKTQQESYIQVRLIAQPDRLKKIGLTRDTDKNSCSGTTVVCRGTSHNNYTHLNKQGGYR